MNLQELSEGIEALLKDMDMSKEIDISKCDGCYTVIGCLIAPRLKEKCGGPWDSETDRLKHIQEILNSHP